MDYRHQIARRPRLGSVSAPPLSALGCAAFVPGGTRRANVGLNSSPAGLPAYVSAGLYLHRPACFSRVRPF